MLSAAPGFLSGCCTAGQLRPLSGAAQRLRSTVVALHTTKLPPEQIGRVTTVVTRAFMNRMVPLATLRKTEDRSQQLHRLGRALCFHAPLGQRFAFFLADDSPASS